MTTRIDALSRYPALGQLIGGAFETAGGRAMADVFDPPTGLVLPVSDRHRTG